MLVLTIHACREFYQGTAPPKGSAIERAMTTTVFATVSRSLGGKHARPTSGLRPSLTAALATSPVPAAAAPANKELTTSAPTLSHTNGSNVKASSCPAVKEMLSASNPDVARAASASLRAEAAAAPAVPAVRRESAVQNYANGDRYEGEMNADGKRDGRGVYTTAEGDVYVGEYVSGNRHGKGVYTRKDGSRYEGEFRDGLPNGAGVYVYENGDIYNGVFRNDEFDGPGRWSNQKGDYYDGMFRAGKRHGFGTLVAKGNKYEGQWQDDLRHGRGRYSFKNGDVFDGNVLFTCLCFMFITLVFFCAFVLICFLFFLSLLIFYVFLYFLIVLYFLCLCLFFVFLIIIITVIFTR